MEETMTEEPPRTVLASHARETILRSVREEGLACRYCDRQATTNAQVYAFMEHVEFDPEPTPWSCPCCRCGGTMMLGAVPCECAEEA